jgi:hypothetical protein
MEQYETPLFLKAYVLHQTRVRSRNYIWLCAWLTEGSNACLLFVKVHLLDRKYPQPNNAERQDEVSVLLSYC